MGFTKSLFRVVSGVLLMAVPGCAKEPQLLQVGAEAPDFTLLSEAGDTVVLSSFRGKNHVVLIFYPGDQTPVCTKQLCAIRDDYSMFESRSAVVFGVNHAGEKSHKVFSEKNKLNFPLLIDTDYAVTKLYGCRGALMAIRSVYVVGKDGRIIYAERGKPTNAEILQSVPSQEAGG